MCVFSLYMVIQSHCNSLGNYSQKRTIKPPLHPVCYIHTPYMYIIYKLCTILAISFSILLYCSLNSPILMSLFFKGGIFFYHITSIYDISFILILGFLSYFHIVLFLHKYYVKFFCKYLVSFYLFLL